MYFKKKLQLFHLRTPYLPKQIQYANTHLYLFFSNGDFRCTFPNFIGDIFFSSGHAFSITFHKGILLFIRKLNAFHFDQYGKL